MAVETLLGLVEESHRTLPVAPGGAGYPSSNPQAAQWPSIRTGESWVVPRRFYQGVSSTIMQPAIHFAVSAAGGGALWAVTGEPLSLPVAVAAGHTVSDNAAFNEH